MQDLLVELFWRNPEIDAAADKLRRTLPGFAEAKQTYDALAEQVQGILGYDLYDRYFSQLMRYSSYELCAYYCLGLGLREDILRVLGA